MTVNKTVYPPPRGWPEWRLGALEAHMWVRAYLSALIEHIKKMEPGDSSGLRYIAQDGGPPAHVRRLGSNK